MRVIGLGLSSGASASDVRAALAAAGAADAVAVLESCMAHPALIGLVLLPIPEVALRGVATPTRSDRILARFGCGSVAEALAILAAGGPLTARRRQSGPVTWAIADTAPSERKPTP